MHELIEKIKNCLNIYNIKMTEASEDESWNWAMNEMSEKTNELFGQALKQIEEIKELINARTRMV